MEIETGYCYQLYNRSNAGEIVFKIPDNYRHFLKQYRQHLTNHFETLAYCLMPTHFHLMVRVKTEDIDKARDKVGIWLSSYTKALNKQIGRHGSLFQHHTRALLVDNDPYLLTLGTYIHQNPVRARLVKRLEDWPYSSYPDLIGLRRGTLPSHEFVENYFQDKALFRKYSETMLKEIDAKYWVDKRNK